MTFLMSMLRNLDTNSKLCRALSDFGSVHTLYAIAFHIGREYRVELFLRITIIPQSNVHRINDTDNFLTRFPSFFLTPGVLEDMSKSRGFGTGNGPGHPFLGWKSWGRVPGMDPDCPGPFPQPTNPRPTVQ